MLNRVSTLKALFNEQWSSRADRRSGMKLLVFFIWLWLAVWMDRLFLHDLMSCDNFLSNPL